jgi:hypothetical protein
LHHIGDFVAGSNVAVIIQRLEGLALALLCVWIFRNLRESWWLFAALILAPDLSMLGYLAGPRVGALVYNIVHSWALVVAWFFAAWYLLGDNFSLSLPVILGAHIGIDRALGFGLKLPTGFRDTHLGRIGGAAAQSRAPS